MYDDFVDGNLRRSYEVAQWCWLQHYTYKKRNRFDLDYPFPKAYSRIPDLLLL